MRAFRAILAKDLRLLMRNRGLLAMLIGYPLIVAALVALALQGGERRPAVAFVNNDQSNRTVKVGDRRLGVKEYEDRLAQEVDLKRMDATEASEALSAGRVAAVITLPRGFISDLQSGIRPPVVTVQPSNRSPIEAQSISRRLESSIYRLNQDLAQTYIQQTIDLVRIVVQGGEVAVFSRTGTVLGLEKSDVLVRDLQQGLRADGRADLAASMDPLLNFIVEARVNLDLADVAATAIGNPIQLRMPPPPTGREPLSGFGFAGALLVSLALVGVLLGAAGLSSEREENTLVRLRRGLVRLETLVFEKVAFGAIICLVIGAVLLAAVALTTSLTIGRWAFWPAAFIATGLAFAAFGVLVGALARETRTALLAALMLALPLIFLGLFTQSGAASAISEVVPFGPSFRIFQTLIVEPTIDGSRFWTRIGQLVLLTIVFGVAGSIALRRKTAN